MYINYNPGKFKHVSIRAMICKTDTPDLEKYLDIYIFHMFNTSRSKTQKAILDVFNFNKGFSILQHETHLDQVNFDMHVCNSLNLGICKESCETCGHQVGQVSLL